MRVAKIARAAAVPALRAMVSFMEHQVAEHLYLVRKASHL